MAVSFQCMTKSTTNKKKEKEKKKKKEPPLIIIWYTAKMPNKSVEEKVFATNDSRVVEYLSGGKEPWPIPPSQHLKRLIKDDSYFNSIVKKKKN